LIDLGRFERDLQKSCRFYAVLETLEWYGQKTVTPKQQIPFAVILSHFLQIKYV
jgi:hypothetical protein